METLRIDTIYLHVTRACNLGCVYCYFSAGEPMEDELSTDEMLSVLRDVHLLNPYRVVFTGGEPLLRKDIITLPQSLKELKNKARLCLTTNGTLIDEENAENLVKNFDEVRISVDGYEEINDVLRGKGSYKKAMKAFKDVLRAGGDPVAFITVNSLNFPILKNFMRFLLGKGISKIHLSQLRIAGRLKDENMLCNYEEIKKIGDEFLYETLGLRLTGERKRGLNCGLGKFINVYPDGSVYPCHLLAFPEFCLGNVRKNGLYSIYSESSIIDKLRRLDIKEFIKCTGRLGGIYREHMCLGSYAYEIGFRKQLTDFLN